MSATLNTFPSLNQFNARSWTLALIILLHFGFFLVLSSGLSVSIIRSEPKPTSLVVVKGEEKPEEKRREIEVVEFHRHNVIHTAPPKIIDGVEEEPPAQPMTAGEGIDVGPPPVIDSPQSGGSVVEPSIDPRLGLSEPVYPASEIRENHTGTVILSVLVLETGRVGAVRIEQSTGYPRLDAAATREAARWRLKPGMKDGVAVAMWKQIPITFQLNERQRL